MPVKTKMPFDNRISASKALSTNDMWSKTIGHDPYASSNDSTLRNQEAMLAEQSESLLQLAKMTKLSGSEVRGGCSRCGMLGHLTFQCRNAPKSVEPQGTVSSSDDSSDDSNSESDSESDNDKNNNDSKSKVDNYGRERKLTGPSREVDRRESDRSSNKRKYSDEDSDDSREARHKEHEKDRKKRRTEEDSSHKKKHKKKEKHKKEKKSKHSKKSKRS